MAIVLAVSLLLAATAEPSAAGDYVIPDIRWPTLAKEAADAAGFAPRGWAVEAQARGDVDGDGIADLVMVLHQRDRANIVHHDGLGADPLDTNPRLLVVATGTSGGRFRLALANRTLIPRWVEATLDDPLGDPGAALRVAHGAFSVGVHFFANAGSWSAGDRTFTFRLSGGHCLLIGFDDTEVQRNTGEQVTTSINYLTGAKQVTTDSISGDVKAHTRRSRSPRRPLRTIDQVGDGLEFTP